ncbi:MAG: cadherin repeat domain-containing protein [Alphaproteobacteria bacterium TMED89]|nr:hypothetical protein [Rhodospirillaceae bacterium]RPH19749.1 MAG: cadherin repeat domain-containing protein [Alphaproteobacteria bacterium TMED89]
MALSTKVSLFGGTSITTLGSSASTGGSGYGGSVLSGSSGSSLFGGYGYGTGLLGNSGLFGYGAAGTGGGSGGGAGTTTPVAQVGPQGVNINTQVAEDTLVGIDFVSSDFKVTGGTAVDSLQITSLPANGTLELAGVAVALNEIIAADDFGDLNYLPDANFDGVETFTIAMSTDGETYDSTSSNVSITVLGSDDAPSIDSVSTIALGEGETTTNLGAVLVASFNDLDSSDSLGNVTISGVPTTAVGTLTYTSDAGGTVQVTTAATPMLLTATEAASLQFTAADESVAAGTSPAATSFTYTMEDSTGLSSTSATAGTTGTINLQIADGNDAPSFTGGSTAQYSIDENLTDLAATVNPATDEESPDTLVYSITGTDAALFTVDTANGDLSFTSAPDFEAPGDSNKDNTYRFNLIATDDGGKTAKQAIEVEVDDVAAGLSLSATSTTVNEGTTIALTAVATNADSSNAITFSLDGGADEDMFTIDADSGVLRFKSAPDFENPGDADTSNDYVVDILLTDAEGNSDTASVTITVDNIGDEDPSFSAASSAGAGTSANTTEGSLSVDVAETAASTGVFSITFDNGEGGLLAPGTVSYALSTNAGTSNFEISSTGAISLTGGAALDFETRETIQLTVTVTDEDSATAKTTIQVNLTDVDEAPEFTTPSGVMSVDSDEDFNIGDDIADAFNDPEGATMTFTVAAPTVTAGSSATTAGVLTYELGGVNGATVAITAGSTVSGLTINEVASLMYFGPESDQAHGGTATNSISAPTVASIAVTASDGGLTTSGVFDVVVVDQTIS